ncbi:lectin C-type domain protein [Ancylostoma ceylanicum]|uniref:Lectin C-type domain protein n=1 Tax=Ancylostoma ceylanicum TaxID=53326 RepID=A0A0D6MA25_9BILA|nr:lectin C-type domain protein [Ancylostoma ceylanicum]
MQSGPTALSYQWTDGTNVDFKNFLAGEPNFGSEEQYCTQILYDKEFGPNFGKWRAANCTDELYAFMCKRPKNRNLWKECNPNRYFSDVFKGNEYAIMTEGDSFTKWKVTNCSENAYTFVCKRPRTGTGGGPGGSHGGSVTDSPSVVNPPTDTDPRFPHQFKGNKYAVSPSNVQIIYDPGKVKFVQARTRCEDMGAELASIHSREEIITNGDALSKWRVADCSEDAYTFVCKKSSSDNGSGGEGPGGSGGGGTGGGSGEDPNTKPSPDTDPRFPHEFKGDKYAIQYEPGKVKFVQARTQCENMGAELASIHSRQEAEFLKGVMQSNSTLMEDAWIGMVYTISATSANKKWIDNSPFDYKNFAPGEPKSFSEGDYCGQIMTEGDNLSKWKVVDCSEEAYTFVCKKSSNSNGNGGHGPGGSGGGGKGGGSGEDPNTKPYPGLDPAFPHQHKHNKYGAYYEYGSVEERDLKNDHEVYGMER